MRRQAGSARVACRCRTRAVPEDARLPRHRLLVLSRGPRRAGVSPAAAQGARTGPVRAVGVEAGRLRVLEGARKLPGPELPPQSLRQSFWLGGSEALWSGGGHVLAGIGAHQRRGGASRPAGGAAAARARRGGAEGRRARVGLPAHQKARDGPREASGGAGKTAHWHDASTHGIDPTHTFISICRDIPAARKHLLMRDTGGANFPPDKAWRSSERRATALLCATLRVAFIALQLSGR